MATTAYNLPTADFVTTTLNGALTSSATTATIGGGLGLPATLGILQLDYSSTTAVGVDNGPETISYAAYNSGTGALTGITRGLAGTTGVAHANAAVVQSGMSLLYLNQDLAPLIQETAWTTFAPAATGSSSMTFGTVTVDYAKYQQIGKWVAMQVTTHGTVGGTPNGILRISLPVTASSQFGLNGAGVGFDNGASIGVLCGNLNTSSTTVLDVYKYNGAAWTAGTAYITIGLIYQAA